MPKGRLMLIDGNSLLHKAFHALPPLANKDGTYTNGVYGFLTMFYKILDEYNPDYISVAFDRKGLTFRHKEYTEYKAGRKKTPNELGMQFPILKDVLDKLNINRIELDGFEADDIIGTIARVGEDEDLEVIAFTGDRDYLQLVSDKTKILISKKGISNLEIYDVEAMMERYGLTPEQFIDLKGLMGDKSDNIPGVPGVGEKTGIKLLTEYKSIEGVYENIDEVSGKKLKERLIENKQQAFMSRRLARIVTNVPIDMDINQLKRVEPDYEGLYEIYNRLGFKSLIAKINKDFIRDNTEELKTIFEIVKNKEDIEKIIKQIEDRQIFCFKFIVDGPNSLKDRVLGLAVKVEEDISYYIDFEEQDDSFNQVELFREIFENKEILKSGHNVKSDVLVLLRYGINIEGIHFDSLIGQYLIDPSQNDYSLKNLATEYLNTQIKDDVDLLGKGKKRMELKDISVEERAEFYSNQVNIIFKLQEVIKKKIDEYDMNELFYEIEMPLAEVLAHMEYNGFKVDVDKLKELGKEFDGKIEYLTKSIYELSGEEFNINSPKQLGVILFEKLNLPPIKKTKTGYSTNAEVLEKLKDKHEIIEKILEYRQIVKLKSTYVDGLISLIDGETNKVHSSFNQTITTTGRISSTEPNLQNIPVRTAEGRRIRKVFVASDKESKLVDADYSQIELRVLAHISNDPKLKEAFFTDEDIHRKTASEVFGVAKEEVTSLLRSRAKAVNFGIIYGISDFGLSRDLNITKKEAKKYIDSYLDNYKLVKEYMDNIVKDGKEKGYVETILNRRRYLPELKSSNFNVRSFGERMAMNTPIQGSAADIIKIAMIKVYSELKDKKMKSKLILQVHDELIVEAHKDEINQVKNILKDLMENAISLNVPLKVDMETGDSWYETK